MRYIDMERWPRRAAYEHFSGVSSPHYMVTFRLDVTKVCGYVKPRGLSFYYALTALCTQAVNDVEALRMTLRGGRVAVLDARRPSFTDLCADGESFHIVTMPPVTGIDRFCREAREKSRAQAEFLRAEKEADDLIYISCLPWLELTALTNERNLADPAARDDCIPRISWGKYVERGGRRELGMSVEVNHRLVDGLHLGRFARALEERIAALECPDP